MSEGATVTQDLTTRDIFQQLNARLTRVEDDLRAFRTEVVAAFERVEVAFGTLRAEMNSRFERLEETFGKRQAAAEEASRKQHAETNARLDLINARFDQLQWRLISLFVITWVTMIGSIWLKQ